MRAVLKPIVVLVAALMSTTAMADSTIVVSMAGEAFDGPPAFEVRAGDRLLGKGVLDKAIDTVADGRIYRSAKPQRYVQEFTFAVPDERFIKSSPISVVLTNDKFVAIKEGHDRNLFVNFIEVNGLRVDATHLAALRDGAEEVLDRQVGFLPVYENINMAIARPPVTGWPKANNRDAADLAERSTGAPAALVVTSTVTTQ